MNYLDGLQACPFCKNPLSDALVPGGKTRPACQACGWIHWKNPIPTAVVLIPVKNKVLMVKRAINPQKGDWCLPGGYVDYGETPIDTAVREVKEETGLDIVIVRQLGLPFITESNHLVSVFEGEIIGGEMKAGDDAEELALFTLDTLPDNIAFPQHRTKIQEHYAGTNACSFGCEQKQLVAPTRQNITHCENANNEKSDRCTIPAVFFMILIAVASLFVALLRFLQPSH